MTHRPLRIGISTRLMHTPPAELGFKGKTLLYLEQSLAHWIMSHRALAVRMSAPSHTASSRCGLSGKEMPSGIVMKLN